MAEGPKWITAAEVSSDTIVFKKFVTLTDAQIKALPTTPIEIVEAQGSGKQIQIVSVLAVLDNTAGVYDNVNANCVFYLTANSGNAYASTGLDLAWALTDGSETVVAEGTIISFVSVPDALPAFGLKPVGYSDYKSAKDNQPIRLYVNNASAGDFTDGNADNTLEITLFYSVLEL